MTPVLHDLHVHTYLSSCCRDKANQRPGAILKEAERLGRCLIGFSDHVWANPRLKPSDWYQPQDERQIARLREDLKSVDTPVRILIGCEADTVAPGCFSITPEFAASLDYVNLSCSHFHMKDFVAQPADASPRALGLHALDFFKSAADSGLAQVIVHPLLLLGHLERYDQAIASLGDAELIDAFGVAAANGVAIEVTVSFLPSADKPLWSVETPQRVLNLARSAGCRFTFGSDAHSIERMARLEAIGILIDGAGITAADLAPITKGE
jgi:histidinol phosphatase-like PHP family hydrolase